MDDGSRWYVKNGDKVISEHATESEALAAAERIGAYYAHLAAVQQGRIAFDTACNRWSACGNCGNPRPCYVHEWDEYRKAHTGEP